MPTRISGSMLPLPMGRCATPVISGKLYGASLKYTTG
jgi:hypothetical protein